MGYEKLLHFPAALPWIVGLIGILGNLASSVQKIIDLSNSLQSLGIPHVLTYFVFAALIAVGVAAHYGVSMIPEM